MARFHIVRLTLIVAAVILLLHYLAVTLFLYSYVWWFDIPMHFLGGLASGLFSLWFYSSEIWSGGRKMTHFEVLTVALVGALIVGLVWELFEYYAGITQNTIGSYPLDTAKDLAMDIAGGYFAHLYLVARKYFN